MNSLLRVVKLCTQSTGENEVNTSRKKSQDYTAIVNGDGAQALSGLFDQIVERAYLQASWTIVRIATKVMYHLT
jgi:hypothetical protein